MVKEVFWLLYGLIDIPSILKPIEHWLFKVAHQEVTITYHQNTSNGCLDFLPPFQSSGRKQCPLQSPLAKFPPATPIALQEPTATDSLKSNGISRRVYIISPAFSWSWYRWTSVTHRSHSPSKPHQTTQLEDTESIRHIFDCCNTSSL
jgi:hypothetical protein